MTRILILLALLIAPLAMPAPAHAEPADIDAAARGVVRIVIFARGTDSQGGESLYPLSHGTGFAVSPQRIVTNAHVVDAALEVVVTLPNGREISAEVIGVDVRRDVAVLQLVEEQESLVPAVFAFGSDLEVGQLAVALGSPFDLERTVTAGIVSAIGRVIESYGCQSGIGAECAYVAMIQTDAPINPGNSGGPLADRDGRVIGMNTAIQSTGFGVAGNIGVGFAIPSDTIVLVARRLILGLPVGTAWLGIRGETPTDGRIGAVRLRSSTAIADQTLEERYDASTEQEQERLFVQRNETRMIAHETRLWQPIDDRFGWVAGLSLVDNRTQLNRSLQQMTLRAATTGVLNTVTEATIYAEGPLCLHEYLSATLGVRDSLVRLGGSAEDVSAALAIERAAVTAKR